MKDCKTCERRLRAPRKSPWCLAFTYKPRKCWAWTDDPSWIRKLNKAVEEYRRRR